MFYDAYLSIVEALNHAGFERGVKIDLDWIQAEDVEGLLAAGRLSDLDGVIIAPGFGERGIDDGFDGDSLHLIVIGRRGQW